MNAKVLKLLVSSVSQRRTARLLGIQRKTVVRKLLFWSKLAEANHRIWLDQFKPKDRQLMELQWDEMETFERSKCLPLSIPIAVDPKVRKILAFEVASMPAKGPLAQISRKKYGKREDHRYQAVQVMMETLAQVVNPAATVTTDQKSTYPRWMKLHFPLIYHKAIKGRRGCVVGQGELKKIGFDPLFALNHTAAMLRANINRLHRRTWCTTKRSDRLRAHIWLYVHYHNHVLTS